MWTLRTLLRGCDMCGSRWRCRRWHVETMPCLTCGTNLDEFHPRFAEVTEARFHAAELPLRFTTAPSTTTATGGNFTVTAKEASGGVD